MTSPNRAFALFPVATAVLLAQQPVPDAPHPAPLPDAIASFGCAIAGDFAYAYGGHVGRAHQHSTSNQVGTFHRLDLRTLAAWEPLPAGPALQSPALVASGDRILRIGGMQARNGAGAPEDLWSTAAVSIYDPRTGAWEPGPSLPEPRSSHEAVAVGTQVLVIGGWTLAGPQQIWLDTAWSLDLADPTRGWQPLAAPPCRRRAIAAAAIGTEVFVVGGYDAEDGPSDRVDILDLATSTWRRGPHLPTDGFAAAACVQDDRVHVALRDGSVLRLERDAWLPVAALLLPRLFHRLLPLPGGDLLAIGGADKAGHLRTSEIVPLRPDCHLQHWDLAWTHPARNRQAMFLVGNTLHVFGGNCGVQQHDFSPEHFVDRCAAVDLGTLAVAERAPLPAPRQSLTCVEDGDGARLLLGGFGWDGAVARAHDAVWKYEPAADRWSVLEALPAPRTQFAAVRREDRLWLLGGTDYDPRRQDAAFRSATDVLTGNLPAPRFVPVATPLPRPRRAFGCVELDAKVYLVGGLTDDFAPVLPMDILDIATGRWSTGPAPAVHRIAPHLVADGARLILVGGSPSDDDHVGRAVEVFDPATSTWSELPSIRSAWRPLAVLPWRDDAKLAVTLAPGRLILTVMRLGSGPPAKITRSAASQAATQRTGI